MRMIVKFSYRFVAILHRAEHGLGDHARRHLLFQERDRAALADFLDGLHGLHGGGDRLDFVLAHELDRELDAAGFHVLIFIVGDDHLPHRGEARGINAHAAGGLHHGFAVERVVVGHGVFRVQADERKIVAHFHAAVVVAAVVDVFVVGPGTFDSRRPPWTAIVNWHRCLIDHRALRRHGSGSALHEGGHDPGHGVAVGRMAGVAFQRNRGETAAWRGCAPRFDMGTIGGLARGCVTRQEHNSSVTPAARSQA